MNGLMEASAYLPECCLHGYELAEYAKGKPFVYGWRVLNAIDYTSTKGYKVRNIKEFGLSRPPQSWVYIDN